MATIGCDYASDQVLLDCGQDETQILAQICNAAAKLVGGTVDQGWLLSAQSLERALAMLEARQNGDAGGDEEWQTKVMDATTSTAMDPYVAKELANEIDAAIARKQIPYQDWADIARRLDQAVKDLADSSLD